MAKPSKKNSENEKAEEGKSLYEVNLGRLCPQKHLSQSLSDCLVFALRSWKSVQMQPKLK